MRFRPQCDLFLHPNTTLCRCVAHKGARGLAPPSYKADRYPALSRSDVALIGIVHKFLPREVARPFLNSASASLLEGRKPAWMHARSRKSAPALPRQISTGSFNRLINKEGAACPRPMVTEQDIAQLCLDIYTAQPGQWDQLELPADGVAFGIKDFPEATALIFRGSVTLQDFLRDAEAIADPLSHGGLGPVHPGFFDGLSELWTRLKPKLTTKPCIVAGHSLGAARASLFTGLMVLDGKAPVRRLCFGEPRPGFPQAGSIIATVRSRSYRNANGRAHDLVTDAPVHDLARGLRAPDAT